MPTIAAAHSNERHRSFDRVLSLVREALEHLGGLRAFVKPGQTVLIKPDQATSCSAESGCTTDPMVVGALIRLARELGVAKVQVAESSETPNSIECMEATGMAAVALREGAELIDLGSDLVPNREMELPEARALPRIPVPVPLLEADVIIAVPKAKTHYLDFVSGAMELWMGTVNVHWREQHRGHSDMIERFADVMAVVRPDLCVTDALICGEGYGPLANIPHWCGAILASTDPVATDVAIAWLFGHDGRRLRFAEAGEDRGLGRREPIVWLGTGLERLKFNAWPSREGFDYLPVNVLSGEGVSRTGTIGSVKAALDALLRRGDLENVLCLGKTPTFMIGDVEDPKFEQHLQEGPYIVIDNATRPVYKNDPRVVFIPGHPILRDITPELVQALRPERVVSNAPQTAGKPRAAAGPSGAVIAGLTLAALIGGVLSRRR